MISRTVSLLFYFYYLLIIIRIFLSWIPNIDWLSQPFAALRSITDPFLNIFRGIIPPIGGMLLQILQGFVVGTLSKLGL